MTWNECSDIVGHSDSPEMKLLVRVLDGWMEYVRESRDGERYIEFDVMDDMEHDICVYRSEVERIARADRGFSGSGGGSF